MESSAKYQKFSVTREENGDNAVPDKNPSHFVVTCGVVMVGLITLLCIVAVAVGIGVGVSVSQSNKNQGGTESGLTDFSATEAELEGTYQGSQGSINFKSTINGTHFILTIYAPSGESIVTVIRPLALNMTMMGVNNTIFMSVKNQPGRPKYDDYIVPQDALETMHSVMAGRLNMSISEILLQLDNSSVNETLHDVLSQLAFSEKALLIIEAALAIGDLEILGSEYPSVMPFYQLALRLSSIRDSAKQSNAGMISKRSLKHKRASTCPSTCTRCPFPRPEYDNDCFGLCGKGCSCWSFVCGDCCLHELCRSHDECCAIRGFFTTACFSVVLDAPNFPCEETFDCN